MDAATAKLVATIVAAIAAVAGQYGLLVLPQEQRADSNKQGKYDCRDDLASVNEEFRQHFEEDH